MEHMVNNIDAIWSNTIFDIGAGDGFHLSNSRYLMDGGFKGVLIDKVNGDFITTENIYSILPKVKPDIVSIDIDGNDYWILDKVLRNYSPKIVVAEFNAAYIDARTIKYDPSFVWGEDDYYGFTFDAGRLLGKIYGYETIFQNNDLNMYLVRSNLIDCEIPPVSFNKIDFFPHSPRTDWVYL